MAKAIVAMRKFAEEHRRLGLLRSVFLCPYLRWAMSRDSAASQQLQSIYGELARSTLFVEATLVRYLESPWDEERRRNFVRETAALARAFGQSLRIEASHLLPIYLPPGQYRFVSSGLHALSAGAEQHIELV